MLSGSFGGYAIWSLQAFLKTLFVSTQDGVVNPMDSTLRDFSGRCIEEFVKWSIKQTTPKQQEKSPTNMKSLFKRIYSLALHPNGFKRLGAALAFNSIYRHFRFDIWFVFHYCSSQCYNCKKMPFCVVSLWSYWMLDSSSSANCFFPATFSLYPPWRALWMFPFHCNSAQLQWHPLTHLP